MRKITFRRIRQIFFVIMVFIGVFVTNGFSREPFGWKPPSWGNNTLPQNTGKRPFMRVRFGIHPPVEYYLDTSGVLWSFNNYWWDRYCTDYYQGGKWAGYVCSEARGDKTVRSLLFKEWGEWDQKDREKDCYIMRGNAYLLNPKSNTWEPGPAYQTETGGCWLTP